MTLPWRSGSGARALAQVASKARALDVANNPYAGVAVAIALVIAAALLRAIFLPELGTRVAFITFYPAVALAALVGGLRAGALATALSAMLADYLWIPPVGSFAVPTAGDQLSLAIFVVSGVIVSFIAERLRRANRAARVAEADRREDVERQVEQRTAELVRAAIALQGEIAERRALEERFRRVIESAPTAMIMIDEQGAIELVNARAEQTFGYQREELLGRPIDVLLPERFREEHRNHRGDFVAAAARRAMATRGDLFALRRDGGEFPVEIELSPLTAPDGPKVIASIVDISERWRIERALSDSEQQSRLIFDTVRDLAIFMLDPGGRVVSWNAGAARLKGYQKDEIIGRHFSLFYAPEERIEGNPDRGLAVAARDGRVEDEGWRMRKDGSRFMASVTINAVRDDKGALRGFVKVVRDITERKRIENALIEANERFAVAAGAAGLGFWDFDIDAQSVRWDDQMSRLHGMSRMTGDNYAVRFEFLHPDDRARVEDDVRDAAAGKRSFDTEYRIVLPDGRVRHLRGAASLKRDPSGRGARLLGVSFDVTERQEAVQALEHARDAAEAANRAKSDFLAVMSHEIRTPMNGIMGMNALLLDTDLTPRQRKMTETIRDSADSLLTIIDDILDLSKLESGKIDLEEIDFDLPSLIDKTVELFAPRAEQKNLLLSADAKAIARRALHGDAARLRQIMLNLVSNAIKFTPRGAVTISVATSVAGRGKTRVRCEVLDTGPGVNEEAKKRLFKPFEQGDDSINRRFGGTGLGLSICKRLVELMDGRIGVTDRPGGGSAFWLEVVLRDAAAGFDQIPERDATEGLRASARRSGRILLAEDNVFNVDLATAILESAGYTVDVAADGVAAVSAAGRRRYDLILMDMQMPELDGLAATREIRSWEGGGGRVPIIAMTANAMKEDHRRCLEAGMDDYFSKPFSPALLIEKVAAWIDRAGTSAAARRPGEREASEAPGVIDIPAIENLVSCLSLAKFVVMLGRFLTEAEEQMRVLARLDPSTALDEIGRQAHQLLASAGTFGARQVQQLASDLQTACLAGDAASAQALVDRMGPALARAAAALRAKYASEPHPPIHDGKAKPRAAGASRRAKRRGRVAG